MKENQTAVLNKRSIKFVTISLYLFITACGGGGGGGGVSTSSSSGPTYSYSTYAQTALAGTTFTDYEIRTARYRHGSGPGCAFSEGIKNFSLRYNATGDQFITLEDYGTTFGDGFCSDTIPPIVGKQYSFSIPEYTFIREFTGALSGLLGVFDEEIGLPDSDTMTEDVFSYHEVGHYCDLGWTGAKYVCSWVSEINWGNTCSSYGSSHNTCYTISDNTYNTDLYAAVVGDFTQSGDMPTSSSKGYRVKALSHYHLRPIGSYDNNGGCDSNTRTMDCKPITHGALTAVQHLTADFAAGTLTGSLSMDYDILYPGVGKYLTSDSPVINSTTTRLGTLVFENVQISGNGFTGTLSSGNIKGTVYGHFFGPNASEIGGTLSFNCCSNRPSSAYDFGYGVLAFSGVLN